MKILYGFLALLGLGTLLVVGFVAYATTIHYLGFEAYMWENATTSDAVVMPPRPEVATTTATTTPKSEPTVYAPLIRVP